MRHKSVHQERFETFVTTPALAGLGADLSLLRRMVADDPVTLDLLDRAVTGRQGERTDLVANINEVARPTGTTSAQALRRLRKDRPDLHARVLARELSPHAAMLAAGFRHPTITVPLDGPVRLVRTLRRRLTATQFAELCALLATPEGGH